MGPREPQNGIYSGKWGFASPRNDIYYGKRGLAIRETTFTVVNAFPRALG